MSTKPATSASIASEQWARDMLRALTSRKSSFPLNPQPRHQEAARKRTIRIDALRDDLGEAFEEVVRGQQERQGSEATPKSHGFMGRKGTTIRMADPKIKISVRL